MKNMTNEPHNETGHLNTCVRDHDSYVTGFGQHARIVVFDPDQPHEVVYCRIDFVHDGLHSPSDGQIVQAVKVYLKDTSVAYGLALSKCEWEVKIRRPWHHRHSCEDVYVRRVQ